ncbi:1-acyl-sn-glycerol-3-phosphate acyltransferase, partial [Pantoea endophytica]
LDRAMGKGQKIPVPFFIDIFIDNPIDYDADKKIFKTSLLNRFVALEQLATRKAS